MQYIYAVRTRSRNYIEPPTDIMFWINNGKLIGPPKINGRSKGFCSYNALGVYIWFNYMINSGVNIILSCFSYSRQYAFSVRL